MKNTLFIFTGAFNGEKDIDIDRLREIGIKTEFLGRVGILFNTKKLTIKDLKEILKNSKLLKKYCLLFDRKEEDAIKDIEPFIEDLYEMNTLGARLVNTLINQYFIKGGLKKEKKRKWVSLKNLHSNGR